MELSPDAPNRYAGMGVMLQEPAMQIRVSANTSASANDGGGKSFNIAASCKIDAASLEEYERRIDAWLQQISIPARVELQLGYPFHSGLGSGTQLACLLTIAGSLIGIQPSLENVGSQWTPVSLLCDHINPNRLASMSGRGLRSAIGLQGFLSGGLILDSGYSAHESDYRSVAVRVCRVPEAWQFVLIRGIDNSSITGRLESEMIRRLAVVPNPHRSRMMQLAQQASEFAGNAEFEAFCEAMEEYMNYGGDMFAPVQGGRYNGAVCSQAVALASQLGLRGVGQSSWGPTVFGLSPNVEHANEIAKKIAQQGANWQVQVSSAAQQGAEVRYLDG
jgi:beta-ribofuranosylaminobenzene 5'-phosphate synthase